jgi:hypothetical protein
MGPALVLLTAALLREGLFPGGREAAAWLRLLCPDCEAAAAAARALARGDEAVLRDFPLESSSAAVATAEACAAASAAAVAATAPADCPPAPPAGSASAAATAAAGFRRRQAISFCGRTVSPSKSMSPHRDGGGHRRASASDASLCAEGEVLVWRRTPSGSRARLSSSYGGADGGGPKAFAASSPELLPHLAAAEAAQAPHLSRAAVQCGAGPVRV